MTDLRRTAMGVFGKAPWRAEYIKMHWDGEPLTSFDAWLTDNVEWAALHRAAAFSAASQAGGVNAFVFRPKKGQGVLGGAIVASWDSAGRSFPLIVAAPLPAAGDAMGARPEILPLVLEDFWQLASEVAVAVQAAGSIERAASIAPTEFAWGLDEAQAGAAYTEWAASLPLGDLCTLVYGAGGTAIAAGTVRFVVEAVRPLRGTERPRTPLTLRLPLGAAGGAAVCFWVDLVRRAAAWRSTIPSFFWSHDGAAGTMLLHLGDAPRRTLADLWTPGSEHAELCDLTAPLSNEQLGAIPELAPALARCFGADCRVAELVAAAGAL
ncbi:MAG TPA: type VI secretion system-associated protein TagF [Polyangiaceae bacterium]|nr:type VI secretion system-associated protein TagF [Polyangiaceae bacterium]